MKKFICLALALLLVLSLAGCGKKDDSVQRLGENGVYYIGSEEGKAFFQANPNNLDPAQILSSLTYTEKMLTGCYDLANKETAMEEFAKTAAFAELEFSQPYGIYTAEENLETQMLSVLPVKIEIGAANSYLTSKLGDEHAWAVLHLLNEKNYTVDVICTYKVSGNTVSFFPLDAYEEEHDENYYTTRINYKVGTDSIDYTFQFQGVNLILSRNGQSITLTSERFANNSFSNLHFGGYLAQGSAKMDDFRNFSINLDDDYNAVYMWYGDEDDAYVSGYDTICVCVNEDGRISFYWQTEDEDGNVHDHVKHLVFLGLSGNTIVMTDGQRVYYYTETYTSRSVQTLGVGMTEEEKAQLNEMDENEIKVIVQKKADLLKDLAAAYEAAGLNVTIDTQTGEIALDSTVLFDYNASTVSAEGQAFLQKFTQIYTETVYSEKYADFVSRIIVEGHTDTDGSYESNLQLSQERADNVMNYCLSDECGVSSEYAQTFAQSVEAVGYSYDRPVYDADGNVDMAASRRVAFRFVINLTQNAE